MQVRGSALWIAEGLVPTLGMCEALSPEALPPKWSGYAGEEAGRIGWRMHWLWHCSMQRSGGAPSRACCVPVLPSYCCTTGCLHPLLPWESHLPACSPGPAPSSCPLRHPA